MDVVYLLIEQIDKRLLMIPVLMILALILIIRYLYHEQLTANLTQHSAGRAGDNLPSPFLGITAIYCFVYFINNYILCFLTHFNVLVLNSF